MENASYGQACALNGSPWPGGRAGEEVIRPWLLADTESMQSLWICRQVLIEFGPDIDVIMANMRGNRR